MFVEHEMQPALRLVFAFLHRATSGFDAKVFRKRLKLDAVLAAFCLP